MREQARKNEKKEDRGEGVSATSAHKELEPLLWQAHVYEEMERVAREHQPAPAESHFAEEYAERAMRGADASANEFQQAAERGETNGVKNAASDLADAGDIAGG